MDKKTYTGLSTKRITIPAYTVGRIDYNDTKPNYYRVQNKGGATLYCGTSHVPTNTDYDFSVSGGGMKMFSEPFEKSSLYLYNPSGTAIDVVVLSFAAEFDPLTLAFSDITIDLSSMTFEASTTIESFSAPLPTGSNVIGKVDVTNTDYAKEAKQYDYSNTLQSILSAIGDIEITGGGDGAWTATNISNLLTYITNISGYANRQSLVDCNTVTSETSAGTYDMKFIKLISNDGETDISLTFGDSQTFILKAGESITDLCVSSTSTLNTTSCIIAPATTGETITFRCLYF